MSCILRISGETLNIDTLLSQHNLPPDRIWKKGEARTLKGKVHLDCGVNFVASEADLDEFTRQLDEATKFLETHQTTIEKMVATPGVEFAVLDFGVCLRQGYVAQFCYFPPNFIQLAAKTGVGVEVSQYACSDEDDEKS